MAVFLDGDWVDAGNGLSIAVAGRGGQQSFPENSMNGLLNVLAGNQTLPG